MSGGLGPVPSPPDSPMKEPVQSSEEVPSTRPGDSVVETSGTSNASWFYRRIVGPLSTPERLSWILAILICATISAGISYVMQSNPVVPGGDPGTWFATAYAFFNPNHPSQSVPLAYPPVLFPLLGVTARLAGGPVAGAQVFAPVLYFVVGLSIFYLATRMLRSRLVALTVTSFVVLDPQLIQMLFWGAYPNLLGFVFLFMALAGIVVMGQGAVSRGALMFWIFALLAVLTHSLTGLLLAGTMVMVLLLTWPLPVRRSNDGSPLAEQGSADVPGNIRRGLFFSRGGSIGFVLFAVLVGGYYVVTALAQVPHPDYFVSNPLAFRVVGLGGFFHSLFPGFNLLSLIVVDLLAVSIIAILLLYSILFLYRPAWLTTPTIVLLSSGIIIALTPVVGWMFRIVSDYTRFGFFLIVPVALSFGYLIDRGWVSHQRNPPTSPPSAASPTSPLVKRWLYRTRHPRRAVTFAIVSIVVGLFIVGGITAPALGRLETTFTKVGHDQNFINALNTIRPVRCPRQHPHRPGGGQVGAGDIRAERLCPLHSSDVPVLPKSNPGFGPFLLRFDEPLRDYQRSRLGDGAGNNQRERQRDPGVWGVRGRRVPPSPPSRRGRSGRRDGQRGDGSNVLGADEPLTDHPPAVHARVPTRDRIQRDGCSGRAVRDPNRRETRNWRSSLMPSRPARTPSLRSTFLSFRPSTLARPSP